MKSDFHTYWEFHVWASLRLACGFCAHEVWKQTWWCKSSSYASSEKRGGENQLINELINQIKTAGYNKMINGEFGNEKVLQKIINQVFEK